VASIVVSWPFYNQALYVGPVAARFPQFGDATFIVSFVAAGLFYYLLTRPAVVQTAAAE